MRKNLAIIGCSYSHWHDSKALYESYPALIAQDFDDYDVYDLSIGGGGNSSAYMRCKSVEDKYNIKIDKVIFQITHFSRLFIYSNKYNFDCSEWFVDCNNKDNYFYTMDSIFTRPKKGEELTGEVVDMAYGGKGIVKINMDIKYFTDKLLNLDVKCYKMDTKFFKLLILNVIINQ